MRAKEFITEEEDIGDSSADRAAPATYALPDLKNQDPYLQYRFGLAVAAARAHNNGDVEYHDESDYGENMIVLTRSKEEQETLAMALALFGKDNSKELISTPKSEETKDTNTKSPIQPSKKIQSRS